ncbi:MAG: hypothetical protein Q8N67_03360, partial [Candidatus Omnitrophota bacterium]|nr:hypothetical protein [Candidatus Omnitrophota bacterium]
GGFKTLPYLRGGFMMDRKMTRKEFLRMAGFGVFTVFLLPSLKKLNISKKSYKEARHYEKLAG